MDDRQRSARRPRSCRTRRPFFDYRKLFDELALLKNIDAVTVSTADHTHAPASILAMRAGKHVYCQKPLTHDVFEAHLMRTEAAKNKVCTQMGNQGTAANGLRRAVELIQARRTRRRRRSARVDEPPRLLEAGAGRHRHEAAEVGPVPPVPRLGLEFGAAPQRPATRRRPRTAGVHHDFDWRGYWDFGTGAIGDMACHTANMAFMALEARPPDRGRRRSRRGEPARRAPAWAHVSPSSSQARRAIRRRSPCTGTKGEKDGKKVLPPEELVAQAHRAARRRALVDSGSILVGTKGIAYSPDDYGAAVHFSTGKVTGGQPKPETLPVNNKERPGPEEGVGGGDQGGQAGDCALSNFGYARPADRRIPAGQRGDSHRQEAVQLRRREVHGRHQGSRRR